MPMDTTDKAILKLLQTDSSLSLDEIAIRVGASKTPIWNRIKRLKESGVIKREVAIIDAESVGLDTCFFVLVKTSEHDAVLGNQHSSRPCEQEKKLLKRIALRERSTTY